MTALATFQDRTGPHRLGMIGVTAFGLLFTPAFYVACRALTGRLARRPATREC